MHDIFIKMCCMRSIFIKMRVFVVAGWIVLAFIPDVCPYMTAWACWTILAHGVIRDAYVSKQPQRGCWAPKSKTKTSYVAS